jgi:ribulose-bisphosphate carboxylase large chain
MSSCELPTPADSGERAVSRVFKLQPAGPADPLGWVGVERTEYKSPANHHGGVARSVLAGGRGERTAFEVRYFEIAPGGFTTLEHHAHEHVVIVLRGTGAVRLGDEVHPLGFGDAVYVAPHEVHQFRNPSAEPFGFLCVADALRDRPVVVES